MLVVALGCGRGVGRASTVGRGFGAVSTRGCVVWNRGISVMVEAFGAGLELAITAAFPEFESSCGTSLAFGLLEAVVAGLLPELSWVVPVALLEGF